MARDKSAFIPGLARVALQLYDTKITAYRQPRGGYSLSRVRIRTQREFDRLFKMIQDVVESREWTDSVRRPRRLPDAAEPDPPADARGVA